MKQRSPRMVKAIKGCPRGFTMCSNMCPDFLDTPNAFFCWNLKWDNVWGKPKNKYRKKGNKHEPN